ncbi:MAG TPA: hypothetical protein VMG10_07140 [Gemmataceae bacterium]|nr:hypothetical protein [Gemmataceae bacterium]
MDTPEDDEEREWQELTLAEFFKGYAESDAIDDDLLSRLPEDPPKPSAESN